MTSKTPSNTKKYCESIEPEFCKTAFFRWASSILHEIKFFYMKQQHFTLNRS